VGSRHHELEQRHLTGGQEGARLGEALQGHGAVAEALRADSVNEDVNLVAPLCGAGKWGVGAGGLGGKKGERGAGMRTLEPHVQTVVTLFVACGLMGVKELAEGQSGPGRRHCQAVER
jgi:hypothetical protein